jgi:sugar phosphate isomerase/epimerase
MSRPVTLLTTPWLDISLEELAQRAAEWGYQGVELACGGDHFEVQRAVSEDAYCPAKLALLEKQELRVWALNNCPAGQAVCDRIDQRHRHILPDYVWGDGDPKGVQTRAAEEVKATVRAAQKLGANLVTGFTGSPMTAFWHDFPPASSEMVAEGFKEFARLWGPILTVCKECGVRFAMMLHPAQVAYDLYSAEAALAAVNGREEFGFAIDPAQLHWQGADPVEFVRRFGQRIYHVHIRDAAVALNGRSGILGSHCRPGDPRRGWDYRSPGHGGVDWESFIRALNDVGYDGPMSVFWQDAGMDRDYGAADACQFVKRLDFGPGKRLLDAAFKD